jgi:MFS family permease
MAGILVLCLGYVFSQFYRSFIAVLTPVLSADLGASNLDLSLASGMWFICFALAQFSVGIWLDRHGPRWTASLLLAVAGLGALLFALATQPWMIIVAMGLIGIGCSAVLMGAVFICARIYSPARMAVATSWLVAVGSAGNVFGSSPLAAAADAYGWRPVIGGLGLATLATAAAIALVVRNPPNAGGTRSTGMGGYVELMRIPPLWPILPLTAIGYAAVAGIRGLWVGPYMADVHALDAIAIGHASLLMALAMVVGAFVYGPLDTIFGTRKWVAAVGNGICVVALLLLAIMPATGTTFATAMFVIIGLAGMSYGLLMAHANAFFPAALVGRGVTLMNFYAIVGAGAMQFLTGAVVSATVDPADPSFAYSVLFWLYALTLLASLVIYLFSRDARPSPR